ncbi:terminase large subunit [Tissierella creatinophila]|uniref:Phage terminase n=1 Tax=Tissierella creatinophila DSM 6911 TaxID=1123403 RepID=A0A1U7M553_TISCR|nr:terminase TerL endonuclease subunit [Tissierella creatinophila]OLS02416.1 phage terminase [Tissierella creatinophila DSM 6911]
MILFDKAKEYANDVVSGKEQTSKEVRKQCKWFLEDIGKQKKNDYSYYLSEEHLEVVEGILKLLNFATGLNVVGKSVLEGLANFQAFFLCNIFGWRFKEEPSKFRYRDITLFIPRKNAKTFIAAITFIILMLTEDDYSEFYSICLDRELAGLVKKAMIQIIQTSPAIENHFKTSETLSGKITCKLTNSFYQARTAESGRNNGIMPSAYIADEIGNFKDYKNINAMKSGQLSVRNPLRINLTTAYAEDKSIMLEELDYLRKIYNELIVEERTFSLLYYADKENLWTDEGIYQANPLRIEENYQEIKDNRDKALEKQGEREEYLCKHMNHFLPSNSGEEFIKIEDLRKCKVDEFNWEGREVWLGLDLAQTTDNCGLAMVTEDNGTVIADVKAFIPSDRIEEKSKIEKEDYRYHIKKKTCYACGDLVVDYNFIEQVIMEIESKYKVIVMGIGYDRYNALSTAQKLEQEGYVTVEIKQHSSVLHPATKLLRELILSKKFRYIDNRLLEVNFQNAKIVEDNNKNIYVNKKRSTGKVDMVVSLINAMYMLEQDLLFGNDGFAVQVV